MRDAILIQHATPDMGFDKMIYLTREHNQAYCEKFNFDYRCEISNYERHVETGQWMKIKLIQEALQAGYKYIVWIDADAMIINPSVDLRDATQADKIGACWHRIPQLHHWNVGVLYVGNSDNVVNFVDQWMASYPAPNDGWFEQGVFNRMGMTDSTVTTISDKWNATIDVSMCPDAVVLGFHGQGDSEYRYNQMKQVFYNLFPEQEAKAQGEREVTNG
jgi:hypothetical protein